MIKLEKVEHSTLTKTIFLTLGTTALIGTMLVFPSFGYIIQMFTEDKKRHNYIKKVFRRLERQELIAISETPQGEVKITLTDKGEQKTLSYQMDTMDIKVQKVWDKVWRVVIFDIPEGQKKARNALRENLKKLGFFPLQKSVFVHAFPCKDEVDFLKHNFGVADCITFIEAKNIDKQNILRNHFQV